MANLEEKKIEFLKKVKFMSKEEVKAVKTSEQWKICSKDKFWWIMIIFFLLAIG